jgi:hypothetical protein
VTPLQAFLVSFSRLAAMLIAVGYPVAAAWGFMGAPMVLVGLAVAAVLWWWAGVLASMQ